MIGAGPNVGGVSVATEGGGIFISSWLTIAGFSKAFFVRSILVKIEKWSPEVTWAQTDAEELLTNKRAGAGMLLPEERPAAVDIAVRRGENAMWCSSQYNVFDGTRRVSANQP